MRVKDNLLFYVLARRRIRPRRRKSERAVVRNLRSASYPGSRSEVGKVNRTCIVSVVVGNDFYRDRFVLNVASVVEYRPRVRVKVVRSANDSAV